MVYEELPDLPDYGDPEQKPVDLDKLWAEFQHETRPAAMASYTEAFRQMGQNMSRLQHVAESTPSLESPPWQHTALRLPLHHANTVTLHIKCDQHRIFKRRMKFRSGNWYCPIHGLQAYVEESRLCYRENQ